MRGRLSAALVGVLGAGLLAMAPTAVGAPPGPDRPAYRPAQDTPTRTPIKHFITLMQENHSFDNYFGAYPGADGRPPNTCMPVNPAVSRTKCVKPFHIGSRPIVDLGHNVDIFRSEYNGGRLDGFISTFARQPGVGSSAMGYYDDRDLPFYYNVADNYVLFDKFFTSAAGGSVWNHFFWATGSPGNPKGDSLLTTGFDHVPTIFDRLDAAGITWKFYVQNYRKEVNFRDPGDGDAASQIVWVPILNYNRYLDDPRLSSRIVPLGDYFTDLAHGTLPAVSFMVPSGASEHPPGSIRAGELFVRSLINALQSSTAWSTSAFTWTYDDWGGWYDHVRPPKVDAFGYGFRAPALLVSPYAHRGKVDHTQLDFTSYLKFIETNWRVAPLAARDRAANGLDTAFDFTAPPREPVILAGDRVPHTVTEPRTSVVYAGYGGASLLAAGLIVGAVLRVRRRGSL